MLVKFSSPHDRWVQPGWKKNKDRGPGIPNGRHSYVQIWDPGVFQGDLYWGDLSAEPDPLPASGEVRTYSVRVTRELFPERYEYDIKLAGESIYTYTAQWVPNSIQIFGEVLNRASQMPGDVTDKMNFKVADYRLGDFMWRDMSVAPGTNQPASFGVGQPASDAYTIWDKGCVP